MTSTRIRLTVVLAAGLALSGCVRNESGTTSLHPGLTSASSVATTFPTTRDQENRVISETLNLQAGTGDPATFEFQAPVPIENAFDVRVDMPSGTELDIKFVTENDMTLQIFDPVKAESLCLDEDGRTQCLLHYPHWRQLHPERGPRSSTRSRHHQSKSLSRSSGFQSTHN